MRRQPVQGLCPRQPQVAEQQGKYLARVLNAQAGQLEAREAEPFKYRHLGSMASIGKGCLSLALSPLCSS